MEKWVSRWEKWIILAKRVKPVKMGYTLKKKWVTLRKLGNIWKKGSHLG